MSGIVPETHGSAGPWQRYIAKERAARGAYLAAVESAHREYLTGPWSDREAYTHVERFAWVTYYAAGRDAWRHYTAEITPPPPPPLPTPYPDGLAPAYTPLNQFDQRQDHYLAGFPYDEGSQ